MKPLWRTPIAGKSLGGVAATDKLVLASGRALGDTFDLWAAYDVATGKEVWSLRTKTAGNHDFGNSPRATPLIYDGRAYLFNAFGLLIAVDLATGKTLWKKDARSDFGLAEELSWGTCGSPLMAGGRVVFYAGGPTAGLVALDPKTGEVAWKTPGEPPGYGSLLAGKFGGVEQIVGHDATELHGWDAATGRRLWTVTPPRPKDFNVPTPIAWRGHLIVCTENNGVRMFRFRDGGEIDPTPVAASNELKDDSHTPVMVGDRLVGIHDGVRALDLANGLKTIWAGQAEDLDSYATIIASDSRVLVVTMTAHVLLIDPRAERFAVLDRRTLVEDEVGQYSHIAVVGKRLFLRASDAVYAFSLE